MVETKRGMRPTNDLLFKRCIGNARHPEVTRGFISDILGIEVDSVQVQNPYSIAQYQKELRKQKLGATVVDVLARLADRSQVVIEMQVASQEFFLERALFYAARHFTSDYGRSDLGRRRYGADAKYSSLYPVYSINILDFRQFGADDDPLRAFSLYDREHEGFYGGGAASQMLGGLLSLTFLELEKPRENVDERVGFLMDFFNGKDLPYEAPDYLKEALKLVDEQGLTREEIEMIDTYELAEEDRKGQIAYARRQGRTEERESVAKAALQEGATPGFVAKITGLDLATIARLQSELKN